ncbi:MAG: hypothetical protein GKR92_11375 [Gammaproteobacteria bacterium]|nr:MAG: hypothetical protein GKR92_11375 [Gammaproteobacteria bacterium]
MGSLQSADERAWLENELIKFQQQLRNLSAEASNTERAKLELEIAEVFIGLDQLDGAWESARPLLELFINDSEFELAVRTCRVLYQADQELSIVALGQGCWLAVTYPINPTLSVEMLHNIVDETPDNSDGAAVAAMAAQYIADIRGDEHRENLMFLTTQIIAKVAKRHRNIEGEEMIKTWIEILELNDTDQLFERLAKIIDIMTADQWWFDRDELRAQLPVN